jgi:hypothetical protein
MRVYCPHGKEQHELPLSLALIEPTDAQSLYR